MTKSLVFAANIDNIPNNKPLCITINGRSIALGKNKEEYFAVTNQCTHAASSFDDGKLKAHFIVCPLHGVMFDMRTGEPRGELAKTALQTYQVQLINKTELWVELE